MSERVVASIEARMGSTRLPGKVLSDVEGVPALTRLLRRLRRCRTLDAIVLATSTAPEDDRLATWAEREGVPVHRGSEDDVLARVVGAHRAEGSDVVVEVTGDCTMLDPQVVDLGVRTFAANECDVVTNVRVPSFPQGVDVQVFRRNDLEAIAAEDDDPDVREHVSLGLYRRPERFRIIHLLAPGPWHAPDLRFQLDQPEDHRFICEVYERLEPEYGDTFGVSEVLDLLRREPSLADINRHVVEKWVE